MISQNSVTFKQDGKTLDFPKSYSGLDWDLIGFRSESWWAIYLNTSVQSITRNSVDYAYGATSLRLDWNAFKTVNGDTLSLLYFGLGIGSSQLEMETTDLTGRKLTYELSGTRTSLLVGYDYFWGRYWGLSIFASVHNAELDNHIHKVDGVEIKNETEHKSISASGTSFGLGLLYNFDL
jgi:hypothetical protein